MKKLLLSIKKLFKLWRYPILVMAAISIVVICGLAAISAAMNGAVFSAVCMFVGALFFTASFTIMAVPVPNKVKNALH